MARAHCPKPTGPLAVASWHRSRYPGHGIRVTGHRPAIAESGPLAVATGNRPVGRAARRYCPRSAARGPWLGAPDDRVKNRRNPPKIQNFRAAAHALASAS